MINKEEKNKQVNQIINEENDEDELVWVTEIGNQCEFSSNDQVNNSSCLNPRTSKEQKEPVNKQQSNDYFEKIIQNEFVVNSNRINIFPELAQEQQVDNSNNLIEHDGNRANIITNSNINETRHETEQQQKTILEENIASEQQLEISNLNENCNDNHMHSVLINEEQYNSSNITSPIKQKKIMPKSVSFANNKYNLDWDLHSLNQDQYMEYTSPKMIKDDMIKKIVENFQNKMNSKVVIESFEHLQENFNEVLDKLLIKIDKQDDTIMRLESEKESILVIK